MELPSILKALMNVAVLLLIVLTLLWAGCTRPALNLRRSDAPAGPGADPFALRRHVLTLSEACVPRTHRDVANLDKAAAYIAEEFKAAGAHVFEQPFKADGRLYKNVVAAFGPKEGPLIVVGAHYDEAVGGPGADDNASGVAGLIETAKWLKGKTLKKRIQCVAYTLEEPPYYRTEFMGSAVHARSLKDAGEPVELMICYEMIGYFTDAKNSQKFPSALLKLFYPTTGNFIAVVDRFWSPHGRRVKKHMRRAMTLPVHSLNAPAVVPGVDFSDHRNYWAHGFDAVMITDTSFYRYPYYHTDQDQAGRLDFDKMAEVVNGVNEVLRELAIED